MAVCAACLKDVGGDEDVAPARCPRCLASPLLHGHLLLGALGRGMTGTTWRARRMLDGRVLALKEVPLARLATFRPHDRQLREAELLRTLHHPGIPHLEDVFHWEGARAALCMTSSLVDGVTLASEMETKRHTWPEVMLTLAGVLDILGYLHGRTPAVIHRDITPANVMRRKDGSMALVDFHAAWSGLGLQEQVRSTTLGTVGFMAPEQLRGEATAATDIYAVGCLGLHLLGRKAPHLLVDAQHVVHWPEGVVVPPHVKRLLQSMLHANPQRRPQDAALLASAFREAATGPAPQGAEWKMALASMALVASGMVGVVWMDSPAPVRVPVESAKVTPAPVARVESSPSPLSFPDVPGSACNAKGGCLPLQDGPWMSQVQDACSQPGHTTPTLKVAGMTPFCQAVKLPGGTCAVGCTLRFTNIGLAQFQQRAEDVAQAIRDVHGRELSHVRWSTGERQEAGWSWGGAGRSLKVSASHVPVPEGSPVPSDIHLDIMFKT